MRRFPISWDKTLTSLGFRRNVKRLKRNRYGRKSSRLEQLEVRAMLSASPNEVSVSTSIADFTATALAQQYSQSQELPVRASAEVDPNQFLIATEKAAIGSPPEVIRSKYVLAGAAAGDTPDQFEVTTEYDDSGSPMAIVRLKDGLERIDKSLQELTIELRLGDSVLARHEVLIDIAESKFVHDFQRSREAEFKAEVEAPSAIDDEVSRDWLTKIDADGRFTDLADGGVSAAESLDPESLLNAPFLDREVPKFAGAATTANALERIAAIGRRQGVSADLLRSDAEKVSYYKGLERSLADAPQRGVSADIEAVERGERLANELAIRLGRQIARDVQSGEVDVAVAATRARAELLESADPSYTVLTGLKANHHLASNDNGRGQTGYSLNIVEEGSITIDDAVRVELGDYEGMVQTRSEWGRSSSSKAILAPLLSDVTPIQDAHVYVGNPNGNSNNSTLSVSNYSSYVTASLIGFDLSQYAGSVPETATLTLDTASGSGVDISVAAHHDLWNTDTDADWDETTVTWNDYVADLQAGFGTTLDTQTTTAGTPLSLDVTEAVQRALLLGDSNFSSDLDWRGAAGDVEAFYLAATDYAAYTAKYAGLEHTSVIDGFLYRNDANVDGVVDSNDLAPYLNRMGVARGDFNLDGTVDGNDYAVWSANFGATADRFGMGDANADTYVDAGDYTTWRDSFGETEQSPTDPEATFQLTTNSGSASFAASETTTGVAPKLTVDLAARTVVQSFDTTAGDLRVTYESQHESPTNPTLAIYQVVEGVRTPLATGIALSTAIGVHQAIVTAPAAITNPGEAYSLVAEIETDGVPTTWRVFDGGVFETADGKVHAHGTAGDDTISYDEAVFSVSDSGGLNTSYSYSQLADQPFAESNGVVSFQAENYHASTPGASDDWLLGTAQSNYTGDGYVYAGPDNGTFYGTSPAHLAISPRLDYEVEFASAGTYYVWLRGMKVDVHGDSVHVGLNGQANTTSKDIRMWNTTFEWNQDRISGGIATITVPSAGVHTINMWMRKDGTRVDKFLITDDANYTPVGDGPVASTGGPASAVPFTGEAFLHGLSGNDTLAIAQHDGADITLVGGAGDDVYQATSAVQAVSSIEIIDSQGLDALLLTGWDVDGDASSAVDLEDTTQQVFTLASDATRYFGMSLNGVDAAFGVPAFGPGYDKSIEVDNLTDEVNWYGSTGPASLDDGYSLREALELAAWLDESYQDADPRGITFNEELFDGSQQTLTLTHEDGSTGQAVTQPLLVDSNVVIDGPGADQLLITGSGYDVLIDVVGHAGQGYVPATIRGLAVTGGLAVGIRGHLADLTIEQVDVYGNNNPGQLSKADGVYVGNGSLAVIGSSIRGNEDAGLRFYGNQLTVLNSTISGNLGDGILVEDSWGDVDIDHSTIVDNTRYQVAVLKDQSEGDASITVDHSLILGDAGSTTSLGVLVVDDGLSPIGSNNIYGEVGSPIGNYTAFQTDITNTAGMTFDDVKLTPLGNYGGATQTHALLVGSPALDSGANASPTASAKDQRGGGFDRLHDGAIDIGAYEANRLSADVVFVVDESHSMAQEHGWLENIAPALDDALTTFGVDGSRYALVGFGGFGLELVGDDEVEVPFGSGHSASHVISLGQDTVWGTPAEFSAAAYVNPLNPSGPSDGLRRGGGGEDGYAAIQHGLDNLTFRAKAPLNVVLISDEDRDDPLSEYSESTVLSELSDHGAVLNAVVNAGLENSPAAPAVGIDNAMQAYVPDGTGSFTRQSGYTVVPSTSEFASETKEDYIDVAWQTGGAAWDLNQLRAGGSVRDSFTTAFVQIKAEEIVSDTPLEEEQRLITKHAIDLDPSLDAVTLSYVGLSFDAASGNPDDQNDAFEIAIIDEDGLPAAVRAGGTDTLGTIGSGSDALFNYSQGQTPVLGAGVVSTIDVSSGSLLVDLRGLDESKSYQVVYRLLNNDADDGTRVTVPSNAVTGLVIDPESDPFEQASFAGIGQAAQDTTVPLGVIDFGLLRDVTSNFDTDYQITTINGLDSTSQINEVRTRLQLSKLPGRQVRGELLLAVRPPTPQAGTISPGYTTFLQDERVGRLPYEVAGLPAGTPFIRLTGKVDSIDGFYADGGVASDIELAFEHEKNERFDFELVVLGELNDAPAFTSDPYSSQRGQAYPAEYVRSNGSVSMLEVVAARDNEFRYTPEAVDPNGDRYRFEVEAGPAGDTTESTFRAIDTDLDGRDDTLVWTPRPGTDHGVHTVTLRVIDEHGLFSPANDQTFQVRIVADDFNRPPVFEKAPKTRVTYGEDYHYDADAFDPDGHSLAYSVTPPVRSARYEGLSVADLGLNPGDTITHLTFLNDADAMSGVSMFSNVRLYESGWSGTTLPMKFERGLFPDDGQFASYGLTDDREAVQVLGDQSLVRLEESARVAYELPVAYTVTADTVLAFDFSSESTGPRHGVGVVKQGDNLAAAVPRNRWYQVYGTDASGVTTGVTTGVTPYTPDWNEDQSTNFTVDVETGEVSWTNIPSEAVGHWVYVDLSATETNSNELLSANQTYALYVQESEFLPNQVGEVDLTVAFTPESTDSLTIDGQTLEIGGVVKAEVTNLGSGEINGSFQVTFFEDLDFDGVFTAERDNVLGETTVLQSVGPAGSTSEEGNRKDVITVSAVLSGQVAFGGPTAEEMLSGTPIHAFIDSSNRIVESKETNNYANSSDDCRLHAAPLDLVVERIFRSPADSNPGTDNAPVVIDITGDGIPEVLIGENGGAIVAYNTQTGEELWRTHPDGMAVTPSIAAANLDSFGGIEVVAIGTAPFTSNLAPYLIQLDVNGNIETEGYQEAHVAISNESPAYGSHRGSTAIANVDADPTAEIVYGHMAWNYNAAIPSLEVIDQSPLPEGLSPTYGINYYAPMAVVADFDGDGAGDIVVGNKAITADGQVLWVAGDKQATPTGDVWTADVPDGLTGILDVITTQDSDNYAVGPDGRPDVVHVSDGHVRLLAVPEADGIDGIASAYAAWTTVLPTQEPREYSIHDNGFGGSDVGGAPLIADLDNDGNLEIGVANQDTYVVLDAATGSILWTYPILDDSSGEVTSTAMDLNGDGRVEIVVADQRALYLLNTPDDPNATELVPAYTAVESEADLPSEIFGDDTLGMKYIEGAAFYRNAGTIADLPVIADIDADGNAEILLSAENLNFSGSVTFPVLPNEPGYITAGLQNTDPGAGGDAYYVLGGKDNSWMPTRRIWNQQSYHVTNINDDGTVPVTETPSWQENNTYLQNTSNLDALAAPDLIPSFLRHTDTPVSESLTIRIGNGGSAATDGSFVIRFSSDETGATVVLGEVTVDERLERGRYVDVTLPLMSTVVDLSNVTVIVDPDDSGGDGDIRECREDNNTYVAGDGLRVSNGDPVFDYTPVLSVREGQTYTDKAVANDPDGDRVTYRPIQVPQGMSVDSDGNISWKPTATQALQPSHPVTIVADDGYNGVDSFSFAIQVQPLNTNPVFENTFIPARTGQTFYFDIDAYDPDAGDVLTYTLKPYYGSYTPGTRPVLGPVPESSWPEIQTAPPNRLSWDSPPPGDFYYRLTVLDGKGGSTTRIVNINVAAASDRPQFQIVDDSSLETVNGDPVHIPEQDATVGMPWTFKVHAQDAPSGDSRFTTDPNYKIELLAGAIANGVSYDQSTGLLRWVPQEAMQWLVDLRATDPDGNKTTITFGLTARNEGDAGDNPARIVSEPQQKIAVAGRPWTYRIEAEDLDRDDVTITVESFVDGIGNPLGTPAAPVVGQGTATLLFEQMIPTGVQGPLTLVVSADDGLDGAGPDDQRIYTIGVEHNSPPMLTLATDEVEAELNSVSTLPIELDLIDFDSDDVLVELVTPSSITGVWKSGPDYSSATVFSGPVTASPDPNSPTKLYFDFTPTVLGPSTATFRISDGINAPIYQTVKVTGQSASEPVAFKVEARDTASLDAEYVAKATRTDNSSTATQFALLVNGVPTSEIGTGTGPLPVGMAIDPETGRITWSPDASQLTQPADDPYEFTVVLIDVPNSAVLKSLGPLSVVVVNRFENSPPTIESDPDEVRFSLTDPFSYTLIGDDAENDPLTWKHVSGPGSLLGDVFTWLPTVGDLNRTQYAVIQVHDPYGPGETQTIELSLSDAEPSSNGSPSNTPPRITSTPTRPGKVGETYRYTVRGEDDNGHDFRLIEPPEVAGNAALSWSGNPDGTATLTWIIEANPVVVSFGIVDEKGLRGSTPQITFTPDTGTGTGSVDTPVVINSLPKQAIAVGSLYDDVLDAFDPDGQISYAVTNRRLVEGGNQDAIDQLSINSSGQFIGFTPSTDTHPDVVGIYEITVEASQGGTSASVAFSLQVFEPGEDLAPTLDGIPNGAVTQGQTFSYQATGRDDGRFEFYLVDGNSDLVRSYDGVDITADGLITTTAPETPLPAWKTITVQILDNAEQTAISPQSFTLDVVTDQPPTVTLLATPARQEVGGEVVITVLAADDIRVADVRVEVIGPGLNKSLEVASDNTARFTIPGVASVNNPYTVTATVIDSAANDAVETIDVMVRNVNLSIPKVHISSEDGFVLEELWDLEGWIVDDNLVYYSIVAIPTGGGAPIVLREEEIEDTGGDPLDNLGMDGSPTLLYTINPLTLANGSYDFIITARDDADEESSATAFYQVRSQTKLGNFALSFTDMTVPVAGFPLSVVRSYDSNDIEQDGEFGYGWSLDVVSGHMEYLSPGQSNAVGNFTFGSKPMYGGDAVTLRIPGGEEHQFTVVPVAPDTTGAASNSGVAQQVALAFRPEAGQASTLEFVSRDRGAPQYGGLTRFFYPRDFESRLTEQQYLNKFVGALGYYQGDGSFAGDAGGSIPINPSTLNANFKLTTRNGVEYLFDSKTNQLIEATDREDNRMEFTPSRVSAFNGDGVLMGELKVQRENGRITQIADESDNVLRYEYENGLLKRFYDRTNGGDIPTAEYFYGENTYSASNDDTLNLDDRIDVPFRVLTSIRNAVTPVEINDEPGRALTIGWDADGRVHQIGDASGASAGFTYTADLQETLNNNVFAGFSSEVVTDAFDVPTEIVRDARGNVVRRLQRVEEGGTGDAWLVTIYQYDSEDRQIAESKPFTVDESEPSVDPNARYTALPPGADGQSFTTDPDDETNFDASYWVGIQKYNDKGNLVVSVDAAGVRTDYKNYNDEYGFAGNVTSSDGSSTTTSSQPNGLDGRLQTTTQINDGEDSVTQLRFEGPNLKGVSQGTSSNSLREVSGLFYDRQLRLASTTDASGVATHFVYDRNDNQVLSYTQWVDPNAIDSDIDFTIVTRTDYDWENRVVGSSQYEIDHASLIGPLALSSVDRLVELASQSVAKQLWSTSTQYNATGQVVRSIDRNGTNTYTLYDIRGNAVETRTQTLDPNPALTDPAWVVTRTAYDANGRVVATTDPIVVRNPHHPLAIDEGNDDAPLFTPDNDTVIRPDDSSAWDDADYRLTHTLYDDLGRVEETRRVAGVPVGLLLPFVANEPSDNLYGTTFNFDGTYADAPMTAEVLSRSQTFYDTAGRVDYTVAYAEATPETTRVETHFQYDTSGRQTKVATVHDADLNGTIDATFVNGRLDFSITNGEAFIAETEYDPITGRQSATIDARGVRTEYRYDTLGRVIETFADADGERVRTATKYDHAGRRIRTTDALSQSTQYGYDPATGRLTSVTLPGVTDDSRGSVTGQAVYEYGYDQYGNQTSITDPRQSVTEFEFDHLGRQTKRTLPEGVASTGIAGDFVERRYYDDTPIDQIGTPSNPSVGGGQLAFSIDFEGRVTQYLYDNSPGGGGRLVEERYYSGATINDSTTTADLATLTGHDDLVTHAYDALGRRTQTAFTRDLGPGESIHTTTTTYDAEGRRTQIATNEGVINYEFDKLGRLTGTHTDDSNIEHGYDALGRLTSVKVVERGGQTVVSDDKTTYSYDANGNLSRTVGPDGVISDHAYDNLNRLDLLQHYIEVNNQDGYQPGDQLFAEYDYFLQGDGRRSGVVEKNASGNETAIDWFYDELGRLVEERYDAPSTADDFISRYGYDLASNRVRHEQNHDNAEPASFNADDTTTYNVDKNDRLRSETTTGDNPSSTTYEYDHPDGGDNLGTKQTAKHVDGDTHAYEYDNQGRLKRATVTVDSEQTDTTYKYDAGGVRVSQTTDGVTTEYVIDPQNATGYAKALEEFVDGQLARSYAFGHAVLSQAIHGPGAAVHTLLADGHGSTRLLLAGLTAVQAYNYDAFGKELNFDPQTALTKWLFAGDGVYDPASRLTQHLDRWRDGHVFLSVDAYAGSSQDPLSFHKYLYVHADPLSGIDPSGRSLLVSTAFANSASLRGRQANAKAQLSTQARVSTRILRAIVQSSMAANLAFAASNPKLQPYLPFASAYTATLIAKFNKVPVLNHKFAERIIRLAGLNALAATAHHTAQSVLRNAGINVRVGITPLGFPDFSNALKPGFSTVFMTLTGSRSRDNTRANALIGRTNKKDGYVWHHHEVPGIMQLVRSDVHSLFFAGNLRHTGGVAYWEIANNKKY